MKYRVLVDTSVRKSANPKDAAFDEWVDFPAGSTVSRWPAHADVDGWVKAGHWVKDEPVVEDDDGNP